MSTCRVSSQTDVSWYFFSSFSRCSASPSPLRLRPVTVFGHTIVVPLLFFFLFVEKTHMRAHTHTTKIREDDGIPSRISNTTFVRGGGGGEGKSSLNPRWDACACTRDKEEENPCVYTRASWNNGPSGGFLR